MTAAPILTTARLRLRPMTMADWPAYCALMGSARACYMGGPFSEQMAWGMFCQDVGQWALFGHGALMFDHQDTGCVLGQVGINHGPLFPEKELGWMTFTEAEGHGYALEAAIAIRDWGFANLQVGSFVSYIDPANQRSIGLAERLGAKLDPEAPRQAPEDLVFRHFRP